MLSDARNLTYDLDTCHFIDARTGDRLSKEALARSFNAGRTAGAIPANGAGWRTVARGAVLQADGQTHARNKALASGQNPDLTEAKYWMGLAGNEVNAHRPETASSNAVAAHWLELLNSEIDSPATTASNGSSTADPVR
jgi:hypothetical protein